MESLAQSLIKRKAQIDAELMDLEQQRFECWCNYVETVLQLLTPAEIHQGAEIMDFPKLFRSRKADIDQRFAGFRIVYESDRIMFCWN